jgi:hypothetical protein
MLFGGEGGSEEGGQVGAGRANLNLKCGATQHDAAQAYAAPLCMAPHSPTRARLADVADNIAPL